MNAHVTICAVLVSRVGHIVGSRKHWHACAGTPEITRAVMAFEAKRKNNWSAQKPGIHRAVRVVAHLAPLNPNRRVLECKWTAFIDVALQTSFFICKCLMDECGASGHSPCRCEGPMRVMTVTASHEAFINAMPKRHGKIGSNVSMAAVTQFRLSLGQ